jgi:hypothetical protein
MELTVNRQHVQFLESRHLLPGTECVFLYHRSILYHLMKRSPNSFSLPSSSSRRRTTQSSESYPKVPSSMNSLEVRCYPFFRTFSRTMTSLFVSAVSLQVIIMKMECHKYRIYVWLSLQLPSVSLLTLLAHLSQHDCMLMWLSTTVHKRCYSRTLTTCRYKPFVLWVCVLLLCSKYLICTFCSRFQGLYHSPVCYLINNSFLSLRYVTFIGLLGIQTFVGTYLRCTEILGFRTLSIVRIFPK